VRTIKDRAKSLLAARNRANDPAWKKLWNDKLIQLLSPHTWEGT